MSKNKNNREVTKEEVISYLLKSPKIISVEYKDGEFHVLTIKGSAVFTLNFVREKGLAGVA
ncbi:MAG: hypothetical protein NT136_00405 [Candidatus Moranbacteria bacterium]|nr:hypothetical protein [Candidatus Moranbacteria bacterium]